MTRAGTAACASPLRLMRRPQTPANLASMSIPARGNASGLPDTAVLVAMADALAWPLLLLRADAQLLHANRAARQVLARGAPLRLQAGGRVTTAAPAQGAAFAAALTAAAAGQRPLLLGPGCSLALASLSDTPGARGPVLVALAPADTAQPADLRGFASAHGLSPAETRVLARMAQGERPGDAARALGISAATARSQLAAIRHKTGHASVAALVAAASAALAPWPEPLA